MKRRSFSETDNFEFKIGASSTPLHLKKVITTLVTRKRNAPLVGHPNITGSNNIILSPEKCIKEIHLTSSVVGNSQSSTEQLFPGIILKGGIPKSIYSPDRRLLSSVIAEPGEKDCPKQQTRKNKF
jgi:hypothetical protein